jgi:hypothetical protein
MVKFRLMVYQRKITRTPDVRRWVKTKVVLVHTINANVAVQAQLNSGAQPELGHQNMKLFAPVILQLQSTTETG